MDMEEAWGAEQPVQSVPFKPWPSTLWQYILGAAWSDLHLAVESLGREGAEEFVSKSIATVNRKRLGDHGIAVEEDKTPIGDAIRDALIARGWQIDKTAVENASGEVKEFIHPQNGRRLAWLDAILSQEDREVRESKH
jgi:hypothetical protein